jgi:hypothetical protein
MTTVTPLTPDELHAWVADQARGITVTVLVRTPDGTFEFVVTDPEPLPEDA